MNARMRMPAATVLTVLTVVLFHAVDGLSFNPSSTATTRKVRLTAVEPVAQRKFTTTTTMTTTTTSSSQEDMEFGTDRQLEDYENDAGGAKRLQVATGSEVADRALQDKIDASKGKPNDFVNTYDASSVEKFAMMVGPQQLPRPAVSALTAANKSNNNNNKSLSSSNGTRRRVTLEEEQELARRIQRGAALHNVKTEFETKHGREIGKTEWMELAGLTSVRELRQRVLDYRRSKQELVSANIGLVHAVVRGLGKRRGDEYDEFVQEGSLGLLRAAELFDPSRGVRFSSYATIWIKGVLSYFRVGETIKIPISEKNRWNKIKRANAELSGHFQREPTHQEIATYMGVSREAVAYTTRMMSQVRNVMSLDYEYQTQSRGGEPGTNTWSLRDKSMASDIDFAYRAQMQADVVAALANNLNEREARLMRLRYGLGGGPPRTMPECADIMGVSRSRIIQLARGCLDKLKEADEAKILQEYLLTIS